MNVFDEMGKYWSEIADQNQTERQLQFLKANLKAGGLVLDLACGTGRHLIGLGKVGYDVVGLDVSVNLLKIAKNRWHQNQLVRGDMRFLPFKQQAFVAAISMDQSFGYLPSLQDDLQSLIDLCASLVKGGVLIIDLFNREHLIKKNQVNPLAKRHEYPSFFLVEKKTIDFDSETLHEQWTVYDRVVGDIKVFEHTTRLYAFGDVQCLLEKADFCIRAVYGDYEMQSWTDDSKRLIFLAKAI